MSSRGRTTQALIDELVKATGARDAIDAVRQKARELIGQYVSHFGEMMPVSVDALASMLDINRSEEPPIHSDDAEISPDGSGGVTMRVNPARPETRQRFSVAHEISHTFFPGFAKKAWCRTDARYRDRNNPDEYLEMLCDIAAAELLLPLPWFLRDAAAAIDPASLVALANKYHASCEATLRRYAEVSSEVVAAVYFHWKLKPTQRGKVGNPAQTNLFGVSPAEERRDALRLRIDYSIRSPAFQTLGLFLPQDKSIASDGPIYRAAATGLPQDGECHLDFGQAAGTYQVAAVPLWATDESLGAAGENAVAAIIRPVSVKSATRSKMPQSPTLFDKP